MSKFTQIHGKDVTFLTPSSILWCWITFPILPKPSAMHNPAVSTSLNNDRVRGELSNVSLGEILEVHLVDGEVRSVGVVSSEEFIVGWSLNKTVLVWTSAYLGVVDLDSGRVEIREIHPTRSFNDWRLNAPCIQVAIGSLGPGEVLEVNTDQTELGRIQKRSLPDFVRDWGHLLNNTTVNLSESYIGLRHETGMMMQTVDAAAR
ncbi:MAG: hypothetical protein WCJ09_12410 [Planctomycetota bacterium]